MVHISGTHNSGSFVTNYISVWYVFKATSLSIKPSKDRVNPVLFVGVTHERNAKKSTKSWVFKNAFIVISVHFRGHITPDPIDRISFCLERLKGKIALYITTKRSCKSSYICRSYNGKKTPTNKLPIRKFVLPLSAVAQCQEATL